MHNPKTLMSGQRCIGVPAEELGEGSQNLGVHSLSRRRKDQSGTTDGFDGNLVHACEIFENFSRD
jgi:hypothetical protein